MTPALTYLVRHAAAEAQSPDGDAGRRLTAEGRARFAALARSLASRVAVTRILTSPLARARETAHLLADATRGKVEEDAALASGASTGRDLLERARRAGPGVAIVGHNPEVAEAVAAAAGRNEAVPPGTVAALALDGGAVRLAWIERPADG